MGAEEHTSTLIWALLCWLSPALRFPSLFWPSLLTPGIAVRRGKLPPRPIRVLDGLIRTRETVWKIAMLDYLPEGTTFLIVSLLGLVFKERFQVTSVGSKIDKYRVPGPCREMRKLLPRPPPLAGKGIPCVHQPLVSGERSQRRKEQLARPLRCPRAVPGSLGCPQWAPDMTLELVLQDEPLGEPEPPASHLQVQGKLSTSGGRAGSWLVSPMGPFATHREPFSWTVKKAGFRVHLDPHQDHSGWSPTQWPGSKRGEGQRATLSLQVPAARWQSAPRASGGRLQETVSFSGPSPGEGNPFLGGLSMRLLESLSSPGFPSPDNGQAPSELVSVSIFPACWAPQEAGVLGPLPFCSSFRPPSSAWTTLSEKKLASAEWTQLPRMAFWRSTRVRRWEHRFPGLKPALRFPARRQGRVPLVPPSHVGGTSTSGAGVLDLETGGRCDPTPAGRPELRWTRQGPVQGSTAHEGAWVYVHTRLVHAHTALSTNTEETGAQFKASGDLLSLLVAGPFGLLTRKERRSFRRKGEFGGCSQAVLTNPTSHLLPLPRGAAAGLAGAAGSGTRPGFCRSPPHRAGRESGDES
ncbi:hypothetical protein Cadr_000029815 [Camelus dromedarius]|uniref:Uncharacterized protein n=1 Tax=Camelus dromedarius TaxID=9838 RepID=A0A5N4CDA3_CAMDR|nr:hypothetical protein Cadr_000029815 [Camelus dromedarius]